MFLFTLSYCNMIAYHVLKGYRISLYLEYPPLLISNTIIILLILKYCASSTKSLKLTLLMTFLLYLLIFTGFISSNLITHLVTASIPLGIMSKVIQLWKIISTKQSGSVSGLSWALNATAGFSRLISLILSVGDTFLIFSLTCSASLNTAVALAAFYYSKNTLVQPTKND